MIRPYVIKSTFRLSLVAAALFVAVFAFSAAAQVPASAQASTQASTLSPEERGDLQMAKKNYREAIDSYRDELLQHPNNAVAWNKMGIANHQLLDLPRARAFYEKAVKVNHRYSEAINNLGTIYYAQKNYRRAIRLYEQALEIAPDSASIHSNLGTALFARKKYPEAIDHYQKALALDPEVFEHHNAYGVLLQERSVQDRAMFDFILARTYAAGNNNEKCLEYLRKALEEGFKEPKKIYDDPAFAQIVKLEQFTLMMANPPVALPR
jgi:tetratricopeptide (TPR) repeat protein